LPRMSASPVPMYTTSGFEADTATAPTEALVIWPSVTGCHDSPAFVVFHNPPPTAPKYASFGWPTTPLTAIDRPPRSGPTLRHLYVFQMAESTGGGDPGRTGPWRPLYSAPLPSPTIPAVAASATDNDMPARANTRRMDSFSWRF